MPAAEGESSLLAHALACPCESMSLAGMASGRSGQSRRGARKAVLREPVSLSGECFGVGTPGKTREAVPVKAKRRGGHRARTRCLAQDRKRRRKPLRSVRSRGWICLCAQSNARARGFSTGRRRGRGHHVLCLVEGFANKSPIGSLDRILEKPAAISSIQRTGISGKIGENAASSRRLQAMGAMAMAPANHAARYPLKEAVCGALRSFRCRSRPGRPLVR